MSRGLSLKPLVEINFQTKRICVSGRRREKGIQLRSRVFIQGISSHFLGQWEGCHFGKVAQSACLCCHLRTGHKNQTRMSCLLTNLQSFSSAQVCSLCGFWLDSCTWGPDNLHTCAHKHVCTQVLTLLATTELSED